MVVTSVCAGPIATLGFGAEENVVSDTAPKVRVALSLLAHRETGHLEARPRELISPVPCVCGRHGLLAGLVEWLSAFPRTGLHTFFLDSEFLTGTKGLRYHT